MARRTAALKPQLNQIRTWAREGRTNAWIAYQLGTTSQTVHDFRQEFGLDKAPGAPVQEPVTPELVVQQITFDSPPPLPPLEEPAADEAEAPAKPKRARRSRGAKADTAALEAEVEGQSEGSVDEAAAFEPEPERARRPRRRRSGRGGAGAASAEATAETPAETPAPETAEPAEPAGRKPRRRGRGTPAYTASIVSGAVLVLDPAIVRSAAWRANWADNPAFDVQIEDDQIVLRRRSDG
jgi:hypothetical protein